MFYEQLIYLCKKHDEKPTPLIKKLGYSAGNIQQWKNGASVNSEILIAVANHFNVTIDYLLTGKQENEKLTEEEQELLSLYRSLTEKEKGKAEILLEQLAEESAERKEKKSS